MALTQVSSKGIKDATLLNEDVNASANIAGSKLADNSISLAKLVHGDSNNNGKFLRANNGADPTFETITVPASINNLVEDTSPQLGGDLQSNGNDIDFVDGDKAIFGTHGDMQIFHDGNNSRLTNTGTGSIIIKNEVQDGDILIQANDGGVNQNILNFDVSESGLASFHGEINMRGTNRIRFYHNTGNGTFQSFIGQQFINNNFNMVIDNQQNSLFVQSDRITLRDKTGEGGELYAEFIKDGAVELYHNNEKKLFTTSQGADVQAEGSAVELRLKTDGGTLRGYIYGNNSNEFGFLSSSGYWPFKHTLNSKSEFFIGNTKKATIDGDGIKFNSDTSSNNAIHDYEEGTFTPLIQDATSGGNSHGNSGVREGKYTKIGNTVTVMINCRSLSNSGLTGSHQLFITNLPFRMHGVERAVTWAQVQYFNNVSNTEFGMHFQINANETIMRFHKMKDNQGANPAVTFNHWMYSNGYYGFSTTFTYITDQ